MLNGHKKKKKKIWQNFTILNGFGKNTPPGVYMNYWGTTDAHDDSSWICCAVAQSRANQVKKNFQTDI